jgi:hypothetical protein
MVVMPSSARFDPRVAKKFYAGASRLRISRAERCRSLSRMFERGTHSQSRADDDVVELPLKGVFVICRASWAVV